MNKKELARLALSERRAGRDPSRVLSAAVGRAGNGEFDRYTGAEIEAIVEQVFAEQGFMSGGSGGGGSNDVMSYSYSDSKSTTREIAGDLAFMVGEIETLETTAKIKLMVVERVREMGKAVSNADGSFKVPMGVNPGPMPEKYRRP